MHVVEMKTIDNGITKRFVVDDTLELYNISVIPSRRSKVPSLKNGDKPKNGPNDGSDDKHNSRSEEEPNESVICVGRSIKPQGENEEETFLLGKIQLNTHQGRKR